MEIIMSKSITLTGKSLQYLLILLSSEKEYVTSDLANDVYKQLNNKEEKTNSTLMGGHTDKFIEELRSKIRNDVNGKKDNKEAKIIRPNFSS